MTTEAPAPPDRPKTECTICPPWVARCAHFGGEGYCLARSSVISAAIPNGDVHYSDGEWAVLTLPLCVCWYCKTAHLSSATALAFDDYDAALAAFHDAEERLLRGDA